MEALTSPGGRLAAGIRVCMVSFYYAPRYSGSALQARSLSRYLRRFGVEPFVVSANLDGCAPSEVIDDLQVFRIPVARSPDVQIPSFWLSLWWFLVRHRDRFDLVHAHGTLQHGSASLAGAWLGRPTILKVAMADSDIAFHRQGHVMGSLNRLMVSRFDRYIATTEDIAGEFARQGLDTSRVRRIPNGVDTESFRPVAERDRARLRRELGLPDAPLVAYVGILNRRKNVDGILRIWRSVVANGAPGHLILVGPPPSDDDPFGHELRAAQTDPVLAGRVSCVGFVEDVVRYLQASDVFLFPSRQEGMPNVVLEAMATGLPVLASRSAGINTLISDGENGFTFPIEDEAAFARAAARLLDNPALREHAGAAARRTVEATYSLAAVAERYCHLYRELLTGS